MTSSLAPGAVDLYWIPLGAGAHVVRLSGKLYEAITAFIGPSPSVRPVPHRAGGRRLRRPVRHRVRAHPGQPGTRTWRRRRRPGWDEAGRFRLFRYEIRRWRGGLIPDANEAVSSPVRVANDLPCAERVRDLVPSVPTPVWGRDELHTGDMWNSNSLISWLLVRAGVDTEDLQPPSGGRAPGWDAGLVVARREVGPGRSR
jgi:hypothetical protein